MKEHLYLAVDGHGNEFLFNTEPRRDFPNLDLRVKWGQRWIINTVFDSDITRYGVKVPKGTIAAIIGKRLTYADEPVLVEFDDYGNYTETRPECLDSGDILI